MIRPFALALLGLCSPMMAADDKEATAQMIRTLPEPFRTDLALRWSDRGGAYTQRMLKDFIEERAYSHLPPLPMKSLAGSTDSTPNLMAFGYARVDRLSLGIRAVQWMQLKSPLKARIMLERVTEDLEVARWVTPSCKDHMLPVWASYFGAVPTAIAQGFTDAERAKGDDVELGRRSIRLIRSISQLHDALRIFDHDAITGKVRAAMLEELNLRMSGWPISSREWWTLHKPLIDRASKIPQIATAFRTLVEHALAAPICGVQTQPHPPQEEVLRLFNSAFAAQGIKPLEWAGKPSWQASTPVESNMTDDNYLYFGNAAKRLRGQPQDRQNEPQWRQAYRDLIYQLGKWQRGDLSSLAFLAAKLSVLDVMIAMPASGRVPNLDDMLRQKPIQQSEEVSNSAPVAEFLATLTSLDGLEVQTKYPGYWLSRLTIFLEQMRTLAPGVQQRYDAAVARQTNPVIQAYAKAAKEGWL